MNGPWHYSEAERLLSIGMVTEAQVHALLALTSATLAPFGLSPALEWQHALGLLPDDAKPETPQDAVQWNGRT